MLHQCKGHAHNRSSHVFSSSWLQRLSLFWQEDSFSNKVAILVFVSLKLWSIWLFCLASLKLNSSIALIVHCQRAAKKIKNDENIPTKVSKYLLFSTGSRMFWRALCLGRCLLLHRAFNVICKLFGEMAGISSNRELVRARWHSKFELFLSFVPNLLYVESPINYRIV